MEIMACSTLAIQPAGSGEQFSFCVDKGYYNVSES